MIANIKTNPHSPETSLSARDALVPTATTKEGPLWVIAGGPCTAIDQNALADWRDVEWTRAGLPATLTESISVSLMSRWYWSIAESLSKAAKAPGQSPSPTSAPDSLPLFNAFISGWTAKLTTTKLVSKNATASPYRMVQTSVRYLEPFRRKTLMLTDERTGGGTHTRYKTMFRY